jgi:hypothetical protein
VSNAGEEWARTRPPAVRAKVEQYPPDKTYRVKTTGQLAIIKSYSEADDGSCETCTVTAWMEELPEVTARSVFGMRFIDLEMTTK